MTDPADAARGPVESSPIEPRGSRLRGFVRQLVSYFGVALIGLVVDFGLLVLLTSGLHVDYLIGAAVGFVAGLIVTYLLSERYVFHSPRIRSPWLRFLIFAGIGLVGLGLVEVLMWVFTDLVGLVYIASKVIATGVVYVWNFFARRAMYGTGPANA
ncbi:GtrA family protein [Galbitalea sp. SE-J8]|uniref:GtrA family protein n=1 Tax=Galbitalea sp. SE-J8 TaxID=3054952 RepID=UPI00259CFAEB|nr:GtrA family protein [Galbitalea sp. SE-J8]MDM4762965.1 GtrA family protein [Galbitalea sp. SE-J8]